MPAKDPGDRGRLDGEHSGGGPDAPAGGLEGGTEGGGLDRAVAVGLGVPSLAEGAEGAGGVAGREGEEGDGGSWGELMKDAA